MKKIVLEALTLIVPLALIFFGNFTEQAEWLMILALATAMVISFHSVDNEEDGFWLALLVNSAVTVPMLGLGVYLSNDTPQGSAMMLLSGAYFAALIVIICVLRLIKNIWLTDGERKRTWYSLFMALPWMAVFSSCACEYLFNIGIPSNILAFFITISIVCAVSYGISHIKDAGKEQDDKTEKDAEQLSAENTNN